METPISFIHIIYTNCRWNTNTHNLHMAQQVHTAKIVHLAYSIRPKFSLVVTYDKN